MPTTPRLDLPYPTSSDPADVPADILALAAKLDTVSPSDAQGAIAARPAPGTAGRYFTDSTGVTYRDNGSVWVPLQPVDIGSGALPVGVPDGYEVVYYPTGSKVWHLRKIGSTWFFLGGAPLYGYDQTPQGVTATFVAFNPQVVIPRPGTYQVDFGYQAISNAPDGATYVQGALTGAGLSPAEPALFVPCIAPNVTCPGSLSAQVTLTAGTLQVAYNCTGAGSIATSRRWIKVTPIAVT